MTETRIVRAGWDAMVLAAKPNRRYGGPARLQIDSGAAQDLLMFSLPRDLPANHTVTEVRLKLRNDGAWSTSTTLSVRRVQLWRMTRVTWNNKPAVVSGSAATSVTKSSAADDSVWTFDVTADYTAWKAGAANYGWQVTSSSTAKRYLHGLSASRAALRPVLEIDYITVPSKATDLKPSFGAVSVTKPVLTWTGSGYDDFRIQIDPTGAFTSPTFDSGWLAATEYDGSLYDLAGSSYGGLTSGSTSWRVNLRNGNGESGWSQAASWEYAALPTVTITNPGASSADPSPPVVWSASAQKAFKVILRDSEARQVHDSGWIASDTETDYSPPTGLKAPGVGTYVVRVKDDVVREVTDGEKGYGEATQEFTYTPTATVAPPSSLTVTQHPTLPAVVLSWSRTELPDEWEVCRDGEVIRWTTSTGEESAVFDGADAASGGVYTWTDRTAPAYREHVYEVRAVVNSERSASNPTATLTPEWTGTWLVDLDADRSIVLGDPAAQLSYGESSTVHLPVNGSAAVKINHSLRGLEGQVSGLISERDEYGNVRSWAEQEADLLAMKAAPSRVYRFIHGDLNVPVVAYNITPLVSADTLPHAWRQQVQFDLLQQGELPWEA